jgi:hypothetical protein
MLLFLPWTSIAAIMIVPLIIMLATLKEKPTECAVAERNIFISRRLNGRAAGHDCAFLYCYHADLLSFEDFISVLMDLPMPYLGVTSGCLSEAESAKRCSKGNL